MARPTPTSLSSSKGSSSLSSSLPRWQGREEGKGFDTLSQVGFFDDRLQAAL
jgi:hypothetical protein